MAIKFASKDSAPAQPVKPVKETAKAEPAPAIMQDPLAEAAPEPKDDLFGAKPKMAKGRRKK